ncbi:hypothetical protein GGX14DRAFT_579128 [Mycena pura]|uniref:Uncharacterized protein n=1 Tax=Mycena pura TaxID=153505 RepID=A0AAD6Y4K8_9AGAR|nr:hypothetical protein GGX14DRAFT_579128 [Mycena pura]
MCVLVQVAGPATALYHASYHGLSAPHTMLRSDVNLKTLRVSFLSLRIIPSRRLSRAHETITAYLVLQYLWPCVSLHSCSPTAVLAAATAVLAAATAVLAAAAAFLVATTVLVATAPPCSLPLADSTNIHVLSVLRGAATTTSCACRRAGQCTSRCRLCMRACPLLPRARPRSLTVTAATTLCAHRRAVRCAWRTSLPSTRTSPPHMCMPPLLYVRAACPRPHALTAAPTRTLR